jgi:hypothetical protein
MKEHNSAILSPGEKIHVMHRRRFEKDVRRHFVGEVHGYEQGVARASGYVFVIDDLNKHLFVKRPDRRTKLIPQTVEVESVAYELKDRSLVVTDGGDWAMDVKEFGWG